MMRTCVMMTIDLGGCSVVVSGVRVSDWVLGGWAVGC